MWSVGATNSYAAISSQLAWTRRHFWTFTFFLLACFFFLTGNVLYMWYTPRKHFWCNFDGWVQNLEISITFMLAFYLLLTTEVKACAYANTETTNELPVIQPVIISGDGNYFYRADAHRKDKISDELNHKEIPSSSDSLFEKNPKIFELQFFFSNSLKNPVRKNKITRKKKLTRFGWVIPWRFIWLVFLNFKTITRCQIHNNPCAWKQVNR